eukprot:scaffold896_cov172-Amphora_coffeaeformis.AAC.11
MKFASAATVLALLTPCSVAGVKVRKDRELEMRNTTTSSGKSSKGKGSSGITFFDWQGPATGGTGYNYLFEAFFSEECIEGLSPGKCYFGPGGFPIVPASALDVQGEGNRCCPPFDTTPITSPTSGCVESTSIQNCELILEDVSGVRGGFAILLDHVDGSGVVYCCPANIPF